VGWERHLRRRQSSRRRWSSFPGRSGTPSSPADWTFARWRRPLRTSNHEKAEWGFVGSVYLSVCLLSICYLRLPGSRCWTALVGQGCPARSPGSLSGQTFTGGELLLQLMIDDDDGPQWDVAHPVAILVPPWFYKAGVHKTKMATRWLRPILSATTDGKLCLY